MSLIDGSLPLVRRAYHTACLSVIVSSSSPSSSELTTLSALAYGLPLPSTGLLAIASSAWSSAQSVASLSSSREKRVLLDRPLDEAMKLYHTGHAIIGAAIGGSGNGTPDGRITPLGLMASAFVCEDIRDRAGKLFAREIPSTTNGVFNTQVDVAVAYAGEPPVNLARAARGIDDDDDASSTSPSASSPVSLEEVVMLGRSLTKPVRDLTHMFEDVAAGIQPATRGVSFIIDAEGDDSDDSDSESGLGKKHRTERDALTDAASFLEALILYRRISQASSPSPATPSVTTSTATASSSYPIGVSSLSTSTSTSTSSDTDSSGPSTPLEADFDSDFETGLNLSDGSSEGARTTTTDATLTVDAKRLNTSFGRKMMGGGVVGASVGTRLALRRMLGARTFASPVEINDARDRMVDYLVDTVW